MLTEKENGTEIHFPENPDKFEFDAQVSKIFDQMARRSIPNYMLAHSMHAAIAVRHVGSSGSVLDIGASHGQFISSMFAAYEADGRPVPDGVKFTATDISEDMCNIMREKFGDRVNVKVEDLMENGFLGNREGYDFINCMYVLQFLPVFAQPLVLAKLCTLLNPGGVLSIGQKESLPGSIGDVLHSEYIKFRLGNGYTIEEIDAKTRALKNSMWPMTRTEFAQIIESTEIMGTPLTVTRSGVFATYVVTRKQRE